MTAFATYNEAVRRNFLHPAHAGELREQYDLQLAADVSESDHGAQLRLAAGIQCGIIAGMAFRVWGCPHLIAALELVCTTLEGQPLAALENFELADITVALSVPVEKAGRMLLLEQALATLWTNSGANEGN